MNFTARQIMQLINNNFKILLLQCRLTIVYSDTLLISRYGHYHLNITNEVKSTMF